MSARDRLAEALAAKYTREQDGPRNPDWDIDQPDGPDNPYYLAVPMAERVRRAPWIVSPAGDGGSTLSVPTCEDLADALLPVVERIAAERAAEELRAAADRIERRALERRAAVMAYGQVATPSKRLAARQAKDGHEIGAALTIAAQLRADAVRREKGEGLAAPSPFHDRARMERTKSVYRPGCCSDRGGVPVTADRPTRDGEERCTDPLCTTTLRHHVHTDADGRSWCCGAYPYDPPAAVAARPAGQETDPCCDICREIGGPHGVPSSPSSPVPDEVRERPRTHLRNEIARDIRAAQMPRVPRDAAIGPRFLADADRVLSLPSLRRLLDTAAAVERVRALGTRFDSAEPDGHVWQASEMAAALRRALDGQP